MASNYHHGDLREALLDAALNALDEHGELPSWRALARACAVSQTAPYRHFVNFDALQVAVAAACFRRLTAAVRIATAKFDDPFERLAAGLTAYVRFGYRHPSWYELMFGRKRVMLENVEVQAASAEAYGTLVNGVAACGVVDSAAQAFSLWCAVHGLADITASGLRSPVPGTRPADLPAAVIEMCVAHIRAQAPLRRSRKKKGREPLVVSSVAGPLQGPGAAASPRR
jgi:AcrR family transcriptional regulator